MVGKEIREDMAKGNVTRRYTADEKQFWQLSSGDLFYQDDLLGGWSVQSGGTILQGRAESVASQSVSRARRRST